MKVIRLFSTQPDAFGLTHTPVVYWVNGFPKVMYASEKLGDEVEIVIDKREMSAGIKPIMDLGIGKIAVYNETSQSYSFIKPSEFTGDEGTPMAIVVIPSILSPTGKTYCISLNNMDASNAKEGTAENLYEGTAPTVVGTYTNSKGVVTENVSVNTYEGYSLVTFDGWNGRTNTSPIYVNKRVTDFENKLIGDVALNRYEVSGQLPTKFTPCRANVVSRKFNTVPSIGNDGTTVLQPAPSGQYSVKGYIPLTFYNPEYILENGDSYEGGFLDPNYTLHYWYSSCVEGSETKLRIPSPVTDNQELNKAWMIKGALTADFDGKKNTEELVEDAMNGVYDVEGGNLIKWDGTAKSLWAPYKVDKYTTVCKTGYDVNGKAYNESNYNKITDADLKAGVELYMFPSNYNNSGALQSYWNYAALTCHCYAPTGSGTKAGDWYCPGSGEAGFALAFAQEINEAIDTLVAKGFKAVGLKRPTDKNESTWSSTYNNGTNNAFRGNEVSKDILLTSTAYDDSWMVDMYMGHASYYARSANQASVTRAFIQL